MRNKTDLFMINDMPMLLPDEEVGISYEDLDSADAGRDESGVMHRIVIRSKVPVWSFSYAYLTEEDMRYMESLFGDSATFRFTHPDRLDGTPVESICYRSKYGISWKNARSGLWRNYSFNIIEC